MRIPKKLSWSVFKKDDALLLVTGKQDAVIYKASHGNLKKIDSFKIDTPHYSDNEGKGATSTKGKGRGNGPRSIIQKEVQNRDVIRDFMHELTLHLEKVGADKFPSIYLFTPSYAKNQIMKGLPVKLKLHIKSVITGNYFNSPPEELLAMLTK